MIPTTPEELDLLAGEYVLGTLEAWKVREVEAALPTSPDLRTAVARWERRLVGLAELAPSEPPPPELWARIQAGIGPVAPPVALERMPPRRSHRGAYGSLRFWRWSTAGLAAAAAALAFLLLRSEVPGDRYLAVLQPERGTPAWVVEGGRDAIVLTSLNAIQPEPGRVLELWALPPGATAPTSLGLIPPEGRIIVPAERIVPQPDMLIEISLEPPGGSPTGRPTGPVLFIGRLSAVPP